MPSQNYQIYYPADFGKEEAAMMQKFELQLRDARDYFLRFLQPRLNRSYKLYIGDTRERASLIQSWQSNVFIPYINSTVETLMPRILDAQPDLGVDARKQEDIGKASKQEKLLEYFWEKARGDKTMEDIVRSSLIYGTGFIQVYWKKDVRKQKFLKSSDLSDKKYEWKEEERTFYDAPYMEAVDPYSLWYDWHNINRESKQFWFKRLVLTGYEIKKRYQTADPTRLSMALNGTGYADLMDYASIRREVKRSGESVVKGGDSDESGSYNTGLSYLDLYMRQADPDLRMYEVFEWWRPFDDEYAVIVNRVPVLKGGKMPIPYDFKEVPFIEVPYLRLMNEFEGMGIPMLLEDPQKVLNTIKNQRLDAALLAIHKMWIVNPLANINQKELVTRPFGIIFSTDPNGVREVQFSDIKQSAYQEEEALKSDMKYASGVDDFSMGAGGAGANATQTRHLRESTLERVRLFVNHIGDALSIVERMWMSMQRQFFTDAIAIKVVGETGDTEFSLIEKGDLAGEYDYKATVIPSIAGQQDVDKKQAMDLFQLLAQLPFVDPKKLTAKVIANWKWDLDSISVSPDQMPNQPLQAGGSQGMPGVPPQGASMPQGNGLGEPGRPDANIAPTDMMGMSPTPLPTEPISPDMPPEVANAVLQMMQGGGAGANAGIVGGGMADDSVVNLHLGPSDFAQLSRPVNLLNTENQMPPTAKDTTNPRGLNRKLGGKLNTNIKSDTPHSNPTARMMTDINNTRQ